MVRHFDDRSWAIHFNFVATSVQLAFVTLINFYGPSISIWSPFQSNSLGDPLVSLDSHRPPCFRTTPSYKCKAQLTHAQDNAQLQEQGTTHTRTQLTHAQDGSQELNHRFRFCHQKNISHKSQRPFQGASSVYKIVNQT
jgi:hypothetical protein